MPTTRTFRSAFTACALVAAMGLLLSTGCSAKRSTSTSIAVNGIAGSVVVSEANHSELGSLAYSAMSSMTRTISSFSETNESSEIYKLNHLGNSVRIPVSIHTFRLVDLARYYNGLTEGAFDITTEGLGRLWQSGRPSDDALKSALAHSGMRHVETADNGTVAVTATGIRISPGRMTSAYALDLCAVDMRRKYAGPYLIRLGDFSRREGMFPTNSPPTIPVSFRTGDTNIMCGTVNLSSAQACAIASLPQLAASERGKPKVTLVDPRSGKPATGGKVAVVTGTIATRAYALAEALLVLGPDEGGKMLDKSPDYEAMLVTGDKSLTCWMTPGFKAMFTEALPDAKVREWERDKE